MRISELEFRRVLFRSTTKSVSVIVRPKLVRAAPISYSSKYCSTIIAGLHQGGVGAEPGGGAFVGENTAIDADRAPRQRQRRAVGRTRLDRKSTRLNSSH